MMNETEYEFTVQHIGQHAGQRLDKLIVAHLPELSRSQIQALIKDGKVTVDGAQVKAGIKLRGGESIKISIPAAETETVEPEVIPLEVIYEDDWLAVIDKPAGMVIHPGTGNPSGTLVNAILARWPQIADINDPDERRGIVHRLDKDTSGVILIAKTETALNRLMQQFQDRTVNKTYIALLERRPATDTGRVQAPIARDPRQRKRMAVVREGKEAVTEFRVIDDEFRDGQALVEFQIFTGRTHQIRVHAAFIGCPVVGDRVYGFRKQRIGMKRLFLHASQISFDHPDTGQRLTFSSPLPTALQQAMQKLR
jgi:23S rRNA pseudouridine1911/1915/1917 synthase